MRHNDEGGGFFNLIFSVLGSILVAVAMWIGSSVSHIPVIEQQLKDFTEHADSIMNDHESRIRALERAATGEKER